MNRSDDEFMARLAALRRHAEASVNRVKALQKQVDTLVAPTAPGAVRATVGADGRLTTLLIDPTLARELDARALNREISSAVADAARNRPLPTPDQVAHDLAYGNVDAIAGTLDAAFGTDTNPDPEPMWNAQHTVAVTVLLGVVIAVTCDERWLATTSPGTVAAEIIRSAHTAVTGLRDTNGAL